MDRPCGAVMNSNDAFLMSLTAQMYSVQARVVAAQGELQMMASSDAQTLACGTVGGYTEEAYIAVQNKIEGYAAELAAISHQMWERGQMMG